jgi:16S rRNA (cytosine967-C5)-methyltransferase
MTPVSRLQMAIELLGEILGSDRPADGTLSAFFRARRFVGAKDRKAVAGQVWRVLRHRARLAWALGIEVGNATPPLLVVADLIVHERRSVDAVAGHFTGAKHGPEPLNGYERRCAARAAERANAAPADMPRSARLELPEWLLARFDEAFGDGADEELAALMAEAPLDLRANSLKITRDDLVQRLTEQGLAPAPTALSPLGLRLDGRMALGNEPGFREGLFEVQDEASQVCAALVDAKPGMAVLDLCAGAGGKTLALAAAMANKGRIIACDVAVGRLTRSKLRLRRAGAHNVTLRILETHDPWVRRQQGIFDRVLVDAPCSGTGAWRRNPDARWRLAPETLANLAGTQDSLLDQAAPLVKAGGRLIYATCSLLAEENAERVQAFLARTNDYRAVPVRDVWASALASECPARDDFLTLTPARNGTDGFFVAVLERV